MVQVDERRGAMNSQFPDISCREGVPLAELVARPTAVEALCLEMYEALCLEIRELRPQQGGRMDAHRVRAQQCHMKIQLFNTLTCTLPPCHELRNFSIFFLVRVSSMSGKVGKKFLSKKIIWLQNKYSV